MDAVGIRPTARDGTPLLALNSENVCSALLKASKPGSQRKRWTNQCV